LGNTKQKLRRQVAWFGSRATVFRLALILVVAQAAVGNAQPVVKTSDEERTLSEMPVAPQGDGAGNDSSPEPVVTMFPHSISKRWWISGQNNNIFQWHPSFYAQYSGPHSFHPYSEWAISNVSTLFTGLELTHATEIFVDVEEASGSGLSDALGLAGFTNLDVVRNPDLSKAPYLARGMIRQIVPLSHEMVEAERDPWHLATEVPARRLEFRFGKMGLNDLFDVNEAGSDSHFQFMNWTADNNGAYDYAADTRGYTIAAVVSYQDRNWAFRFGEGLMPIVANGIDLQWNLRKAHADNFEFEYHPPLTARRTTTVRILSFINHANMGVYRDAINNYLEGKTPVPEIDAHPERTTIKYGFGLNLVEDVGRYVRLFGRFGWNEGQHESFAYTEVDQTVEVGADFSGERWKRKADKAGALFMSNAISADHQHYLALGGEGFLLGDGRLSYGRETIEEAYYNLHVWRGIFTGFDMQHINNPGYNRVRGPVLVPSVRFHLEF
jgi:high affinity Mn2+ porin